MKELYTLKEASEILGVKFSKLQTDSKRGAIKTVPVPYGNNRFKKGVTWETIKQLKESVSGSGNYQALYNEWLEAQATGWVNGKILDSDTISIHKYGIEKFWSVLGVKPDVKHLTADKLMEAISQIEIDHENKNCHYDQRKHMARAVKSFYRFLIRKKLRVSMDEFKDVKIVRTYPPHRTMVTAKQFDMLLLVNRSSIEGRRQFDVEASHMLLCLLGYAGLRKQEAIDLRVDEVHLDESYLWIADGKGHKSGMVPIVPELRKAFVDWLEIKPAGATVLCKADGSPMTSNSVTQKFGRLSARAGFHVHAHALRATCATVLSSKGVPSDIIRRVLRHESQRMLEVYLRHNDQEMIDILKDLGKPKKSKSRLGIL